MTLTAFKRNSGDNSFHLMFSDGIEFDLTAEQLRDNCPCAGCKGEGFLFRQYMPEKKQISPDGYELDKAKPVGYYAIQLYWKDGHDTGVYTWDHLKKIYSNINNAR